MRFDLGRGLRLELAAALALALAVPALAAAEDAAVQSTQTTLSAQTRDLAGRTRATLDVTVAGEDGLPAGGAVVIRDGGKQLSGTVLDAEGHATLKLDLAAGEHNLRADYLGDAAHRGSQSNVTGVHAQASSSPDFAVSVSPGSLTLKVGQSGSVAALIKPENNSTLTAPMFVTLSCQGLPDQSSCTFTPENIEILNTSCPDPSKSSCPVKSTMVIATQLGTGQVKNEAPAQGKPMMLAIVLPGAFGLMGLAWRRRGHAAKWFVLAMLGVVTVLGTSACNPRYNYFNHGPPHNPATPTGTFKLTISAQSNNGITAINHSATVALTIQ